AAVGCDREANERARSGRCVREETRRERADDERGGGREPRQETSPRPRAGGIERRRAPRRRRLRERFEREREVARGLEAILGPLLEAVVDDLRERRRGRLR